MVDEKQPTIIELNMNRIAKMALIANILFMVISCGIYSIIHQQLDFSFSLWGMLLWLIGYMVLIVLHEAFHLIGFLLFGHCKWSDLDYGVNLKLGVAYATTKKPLANYAMKKALLLPFWVTGVLPTALAIYYEHIGITMLGAFLMAGAIGDFYMYKELRKFPKDALIKDDPERPKLYVYD
ncbi:DUF3267 domain-containing protein [Lysinibacillus sp. KU-BSD001]|uniref:DUF3267 domain-containing protein n=1 Tax=Lysinibacillus sp. KU-BSD001 TaxID=3141328 RepID=UPI0036E7EEA2